MRRLLFAHRSTTVLLLVAGVLLLPTMALGARLVSGWQSGSPVVRKIGPLPTYEWTPSASDYDPRGEDNGSYVNVRPLGVPALGQSGVIASEVAMRIRFVVYESVEQAFNLSYAEDNPTGCGLLLLWRNTVSGEGQDIWGYWVEEPSQIGDIAGTYELTYVDRFEANPAGQIDQYAIETWIYCYRSGEGTDLTLSFSSPAIAISPLSVRLLGY